jgi:hypothetical protein
LEVEEETKQNSNDYEITSHSLHCCAKGPRKEMKKKNFNRKMKSEICVAAGDFLFTSAHRAINC